MEFKEEFSKVQQTMQAALQQIGGLTSAMMQVQSEILTLKNGMQQIGQYLQNLDNAAGMRLKKIEDVVGIKPEVAGAIQAEAPAAPEVKPA